MYTLRRTILLALAASAVVIGVFAASTRARSAEASLSCYSESDGKYRPCGGSRTPVAVAPTSYPAGATPATGIGTGTTGAVVGTLAAVALKTTYICGFDVSAVGGTAAVGPIVVAGLTGGSFTYQLNSAAAAVNFGKVFTPCIPASAVNTAITVTTTADGTATAVDVNAWGYQLQQ